MDGMMDSLLIVNGGELAPPFAPLPEGQPCPTMPMNPPWPPGTDPTAVDVGVVNSRYNPDPVTIDIGDAMHWVWASNNHSTTSDAGLRDSGVRDQPSRFDHTFTGAGTVG